jgi:spore maturation protein CgeB
MLLSEPADIIIENDFKHEESAVFCDPSVDDLIDLCEYYLKNVNTRERIAKKGKNHLLQYHTDVHRAKFILKNSSFSSPS